MFTAVADVVADLTNVVEPEGFGPAGDKASRTVNSTLLGERPGHVPGGTPGTRADTSRPTRSRRYARRTTLAATLWVRAAQ
jgi:hypothetical protein